MDNMKNTNWDDIMLTLLVDGYLDIQEKLNTQPQEFKDRLLKVVRASNIHNLSEFVYGYMCGCKMINN